MTQLSLLGNRESRQEYSQSSGPKSNDIFPLTPLELLDIIMPVSTTKLP